MTRRFDRLDEATAHACYDTLVELAGASGDPDNRRAFVEYFGRRQDAGWSHEWRFCGHLGFGGKLYLSRWDGPHVDCYREDRTEQRAAMIAAVNERLAEIVDSARSQGAADTVVPGAGP